MAIQKEVLHKLSPLSKALLKVSSLTDSFKLLEGFTECKSCNEQNKEVQLHEIIRKNLYKLDLQTIIRVTKPENREFILLLNEIVEGLREEVIDEITKLSKEYNNYG